MLSPQNGQVKSRRWSLSHFLQEIAAQQPPGWLPNALRGPAAAGQTLRAVVAQGIQAEDARQRYETVAAEKPVGDPPSRRVLAGANGERR
jgi:hypothetical protein